MHKGSFFGECCLAISERQKIISEINPKFAQLKRKKNPGLTRLPPLNYMLSLSKLIPKK
jgi:hypothetical protein